MSDGNDTLVDEVETMNDQLEELGEMVWEHIEPAACKVLDGMIWVTRGVWKAIDR